MARRLAGAPSGAANSRAIIIHPRYAHQLATAPLPTFTPLAEMPAAVLHLIASKLDNGSELAALELTSRRCREVASCEDLWCALCLEKFGVPVGHVQPPSWKALYRFNHELLRTIIAQQAKDAFTGSAFGPLMGPGPLTISVPVLA